MSIATPWRSKTVSKSSTSFSSTALSGSSTPSTLSTSSRAATIMRLTRSRSSFSEGCELEETEGLLREPLHGAFHAAEVGLSYSERPGQQQQVRVSGLMLCTTTTDRHLVPPSLYTGTLH